MLSTRSSARTPNKASEQATLEEQLSRLYAMADSNRDRRLTPREFLKVLKQ